MALVPAHAESIKRVQNPSLSPDGKTLAFSWQGDIWLLPRSGGEARRLTVHPALDQIPRWTPDGKRIVFSSNRYGSFDLFSIGVNGEDLKRISYDSATEVPYSISPDGRFVYGHTNAFGRMDLFRVPINGGDLTRLTGHPLETEAYAAAAPDGSAIYYTAGGPPTWRNPYLHGTYTGDIWVGKGPGPLTNMVNLTKDEFNDVFPMPSKDGNIYFISNRGGWPNLWRMNASGGAMKQLTDHSGAAMRWSSLSDGGKAIAYEFDSEIWVLDLTSMKTAKVDVEVPSDARVNPVTELTLTTGVRDYAVSPDGKRTVLELRGELFLIPERGGTTRRLTKNPAADSNPVWLDNKTILFVSGRNLKRELFTITIDGVEKPFLSDSQDLTHPLLSPDHKTLAIQRGTTEIVTMPASGGTPKVLMKGVFGDSMIGDPMYSWAPDSQWLAIEVLNVRGSQIVLQPIGGGSPITIARTSKGASTPQFLPNGRGVYFTATEPENPDLFIVDLVPQDVNFTEDDLDTIDENKPPVKPTNEVKVQARGIFDRMRRLTNVAQGASNPMASADSKSIYVNIDGVLNTVPVAGGATRPVEGAPPASNIQIGGTGKVYFVSGGRLLALSQAGLTPVAFSAQMSVNLKDEEMAIFREIWWLIDRFYYDSEFHGHNWNAIRERYSKIVPYAYDRTDFYNMMLEMMEELNSSHLGTTAPLELPTAPPDSTAWLGVEWDWDAFAQRGVFVVKEVYEGTPATYPNSLMLPGDRLVSVNGVKPSDEEPLSKLLNRQAGKKVKLVIERSGREIELTMRPNDSGSRTGILYDNYVLFERSLVDQLSKGRLTYMHIQGMDDPSYQQLLREIRTLTPGKDGVVLDVRFNGGGSTSHLILSILIKQPWLARTWRSSPGLKYSENIWRGDSLELPTALLINQNSFSNAEMFAEGFRYYKLGPIVGVPTAGGVISTGAYSLWDGGTIRMPRGGAYASNGENLEHNGRKPDFRVPFDPNAWRAGRDVQTEKVVEELLKKLPK